MAETQPNMARLEIRKSPDAEFTVGGLRFVACRREVGEIDGGITLYVWSEAKPDIELIRMDLFRDRPHYHAPAENKHETLIKAGDQPVLDWGIDAVTNRAGELAHEAGHAELIESLDTSTLAAAGSDLRALFSSLAEPDEISYFELPQAVLDGLAK